MATKKSLGGLSEHVVATIVLLLSATVTGVITSLGTLILEKENEFVRFHAKQALIFSLAMLFLSTIHVFLPYLRSIQLLGIVIIFYTAYRAHKNEFFAFDFIKYIIKLIEQ